MNINIINKSKHPLPSYETVGAAGMDIRVNIDSPISLAPTATVILPTGLFIELPIGYEGQLRPRSGLAIKHGITLPNAPATIDSDYRGEIMVALINLSKEAFTIQDGDRVAQLIITKYESIRWELVNELSASSRAAGGLGSTGMQ